ncbi:MAG: endonuclease/exonuclease/phosphatase family protein [Armatimonadota bacterium]|nr:endonuclease/exonuclease/phosphatase family protein [Armatimonadota bacterium]
MFRVVTYNIKAGLGLDGIRSIRRIGDVLANLGADVICLQEVDQHIARSWLSNQPKLLGIRLNMHPVFQRNLRLGSGWYGNCILVKQPILHYRFHPLPGSGEPRGLLEVTTTLDSSEITIFCTHLSTEEPTRIEQARKVAEITRSVHKPKILCGDMNDVRGSKTLANLLSDPLLRDVAFELDQDHITTLIEPTPSRIDFILADLRLKAESYQVIDSNASDHRPVVADFTIA